MSDVCEVLTSLTSDLVSGLNHSGGTKEAPPNHYVSLLHPYKHIKEECLLQIRQQPGEGGGVYLLLLFRAWASSRTMYCHFTLWKYFTSWTTSW